MKGILKSGRTKIVLALLVCAGFFTISAADNYFEITKNLEIFTELYKELNIYYVDETKPGELMKTGIDAMLTSLDPYTNYIPESDIEDYRFMTTGQYGGIGALIKKKGDYVVISEPYEGFPAFNAGLMAGDRILRIDDKDAKGMNTEDVSGLLKGQSGTKVKVLMERVGVDTPFEKELERKKIKIPDVPYYGFVDADSTVGYVKLTSFTSTASSGVRTAMKELKERGMQKMVLDLRGNGGGLLHEAVNIVNLFVPRNQVVVQTKGKITEWDKTYRTLSEPLEPEMPLVVLVDGGSASASEIVSGALQDLDRAVVIGTRTFGKGLVQQTRDLFYNSKLKLTVAKYYIPSGRCIQRLDYAHKDGEGKAKAVADSLRKEFQTSGGRTVFDGKGILPDVPIERPEFPRMMGSLIREDVFFDFANEFRRRTEKIGAPAEFKLDDSIYQEFSAFVATKELEYETASEEKLKELIDVAKNEGYFEEAETDFEHLKQELEPQDAEELQRSRGLISDYLKTEIVARYHYQDGRIEASLSNDPYIHSSLKIFDEDYPGILSGTVDMKKKD
jgi:carboxyl-terminal processing protease